MRLPVSIRSLAATLTAVFGLLSATTAHAVWAGPGRINFDFISSGKGPAFGVYGPGVGAIGNAGDLWNNANFLSSPANNLFDESGVATGVNFSFTSTEGFNLLAGTGTFANLISSSSYITSGTISGLVPGKSYDLYLYAGGDSLLSYTVNGVGFSTSTSITSPVNALVLGREYDVHNVTANGSGALLLSSTGTTKISAWQLTAVPEPSGLALAVISAMAWGTVRRRTRGRVSPRLAFSSLGETALRATWRPLQKT
jgi:hypothetical protein